MKKNLLLTIMCVLCLFSNLNAQEQEIVTIGEGGSTTNNFPSYTYKYYSITQQIITAEELQNKSGEISSLSFKCTRNTSDPNIIRHFKIYMMNTTKASFDSNYDWIDIQESNLVYDGNVTYAEVDSWTTINFTSPFQYIKDKNVVLCINDVTGTGTWGMPKCASDEKSEYRSLYMNSYNAVSYDATNISEGGTLDTHVNQMQFAIVYNEGGEIPTPVVPAAPTNLTATASETSVSLSWNASENATSYKVYSGDDVVASNLTATSYTVENLEINTTYCFTVAAVNEIGESEKSNEACATTAGSGSVELETTFKFDFNDKSLSGWKVFQGPEASGPNWEIPNNPIIPMLDEYYKGLDGTPAVYSMSYYLLEETTLNPDNYLVTENAYAITETSALVYDVRQTKTGAEDHYGVVVSEDGVSFDVIWHESYSAAGETKAVSLAEYAGKNLYVGFRHYNQETTGDAICIDNIELSVNTTIDPVDPTLPYKPTNLTATANGKTSITLTWNVAENAMSYNVYQEEELIANVEETSYLVENLDEATNYCFTVVSVKDELMSEHSNEACATTEGGTTPEPEAPAAPVNLSATVEQDVADYEYKYRITMMWEAVEGAEYYNVYVNTTSATDFYMGFTTGTSYIAGTNEETTLEFYVTTVIDEMESEPSEKYEIIVKGDAVEELTASFNIYPNPVENELFIETEMNVEEISIYDIYGRQQAVSCQLSTINTIDVANLNAGVYFVKIVTDNGEAVKRFVKK